MEPSQMNYKLYTCAGCKYDSGQKILYFALMFFWNFTVINSLSKTSIIAYKDCNFLLILLALWKLGMFLDNYIMSDR